MAKVYEEQKKAGKELAVKITKQLHAAAGSFSSMEVIILCPPSLSLREQTIARVAGMTGVRVLGVVTGNEFSTTCATLRSRFESEKSTLFVIVQDEAHYGIAAGSLLDKNILSHVIANGFPNVVHVCVSATPWVLLDGHTTKNRDTNVVEYLPSPSYVGVQGLIEQGKWHVDDVASEKKLAKRYKKCFELVSNKEDDDAIDPFTKDAVKSLVRNRNTPCLVVIRLPSTKNDGSAEERCQDFIEQLEDAPGASGVTFVNGATKKREENLIPDPNSVKKVVLLLVMRFHTGDTFPEHFAFLDERLCLCNESTHENIVKVHQEIGRAYGYGARPCVAVSTMTDNLVKSTPLTLADVDDMTSESNSPHRRTIDNVTNDDQTGRTFFTASKSCMYSRFAENPTGPELEYLKRRFVLVAQPQSGKTGTFLYALRVLRALVVPPTSNRTANRTEQQQDAIDTAQTTIMSKVNWCKAVEAAFQTMQANGVTYAEAMAFYNKWVNARSVQQSKAAKKRWTSEIAGIFKVSPQR